MTLEPYQGFQARADETDAGLRSGTIGCKFGSEIAQAGRILYRGPRDATLETDIDDAIGSFVEQTNFRILYLLPEEKCGTHLDGEEYTWQMYARVLSSLLRRRTKTFQSPQELFEARCPGSFHNAKVDGPLIAQLVSSGLYRKYICREAFQDWLTGMVPSYYARSDSLERPLVAFALGPYYTPLTEEKHPRFAPHYGMFFGYQHDIAKVRQERPHDCKDVREKAKTALGFLARQSLHIPKYPIPDGPRSLQAQDWSEKEVSNDTPIGKLIADFHRQRKMIEMSRPVQDLGKFLF